MVTGASDDDPSGIATYSQAGAKFGFGFLWAALLTLPLMATVQEICDRTALATGTGLGELAVKRFSRLGRMAVAVLVAALIVANALNISADLVAVGTGMNLLHAGPTALWAAIAGVAITAVLMVGSFSRIALVFKILCAALVELHRGHVHRHRELGLRSPRTPSSPTYRSPRTTWRCWSPCSAPPSRRTCSSGRAPTASRSYATNPKAATRRSH